MCRSCSTPMLQGMFPANALLYRRGYLKQGQTVVHDERPLAELWDRKPAVVDDNEIYGIGKTASEADLTIPRRDDGRVSRSAFLVGRVQSVWARRPTQATKSPTWHPTSTATPNPPQRNGQPCGTGATASACQRPARTGLPGFKDRRASSADRRDDRIRQRHPPCSSLGGRPPLAKPRASSCSPAPPPPDPLGTRPAEFRLRQAKSRRSIVNTSSPPAPRDGASGDPRTANITRPRCSPGRICAQERAGPTDVYLSPSTAGERCT